LQRAALRGPSSPRLSLCILPPSPWIHRGKPQATSASLPSSLASVATRPSDALLLSETHLLPACQLLQQRPHPGAWLPLPALRLLHVSWRRPAAPAGLARFPLRPLWPSSRRGTRPLQRAALRGPSSPRLSLCILPPSPWIHRGKPQATSASLPSSRASASIGPSRSPPRCEPPPLLVYQLR